MSCTYAVARFINGQFLGFDTKEHKYVLTGLFDERVIRRQPTAEEEAVLAFGDIASMCEYADLLPTQFCLNHITISAIPMCRPA